MVNYYLTPIAVLDVQGNLLPTADDTYDLGSATKAWQDLFVEGDITLTDAGSIVTSAGALTLDPTTDVIIPDAKGLVIGHTAQVTVGGLLDYASFGEPELQILGRDEDDAAVVIGLWSAADDRGPVLTFLKSDYGAIGGFDPVMDGETLGGIQWIGDDNTDYQSIAAAIRAEVDGSTGTGVMPGRILFMTTAAGAGSPTERMRLDSSGFLSLRTSVDTAIVADVVGFSRYEIGAGNTVLGISQETAVATETDETKFSHKMQVRINGVTYFIMLTET